MTVSPTETTAPEVRPGDGTLGPHDRSHDGSNDVRHAAPEAVDRAAATTTDEGDRAGIEDDVEPVPARRVELPVLAFVDGRSPDPRICPFLRLDADGRLIEPVDRFDPSHVCVAIGEPRPQSGRQQELLCLRTSHANCARYLRGVTAVQPTEPARTGPPRATVAAVIVLLVSIGFSFGFVLQRGGIDMTAFAVATPSPSATAPSLGPSPTGTTVAAGSPTPAPDPTPSPPTSPSPTPSPTPAPSVSPTPEPTAPPTPRPTRTPAGESDRYALLDPCPNRPDCWIYTVRSGDNLFSIANYFGHSLETVYRLNPWSRTQGIRKGDGLILPPPTR